MPNLRSIWSRKVNKFLNFLDKKTSEVVSSQVENVGGDQEVDSNTDYGLHKKDSKLIEFKEEMLQDEEFADLWGKLDDDIKSIIIQNGKNPNPRLSKIKNFLIVPPPPLHQHRLITSRGQPPRQLLRRSRRRTREHHGYVGRL